MKKLLIFLVLAGLSGPAPVRAQQYGWQWAARYGGVYRFFMGAVIPSATALATTVTPDGGLAVCGAYSGPLTFENPTQTFAAASNTTNGYVTKYSATGTRLWSSALVSGGFNEDEATQVGTDGLGRVYVSGTYDANVIALPNPTQLSGPGTYLARYDGTLGTPLTLRKILTGLEPLTAMRVNSAGEVFLAGQAGGANQLVGYPVTTVAGRPLTPYVAKQDPVTGAVLWASSLLPGANSSAQITDMAVSFTGEVLISGTFRGVVSFGSSAGLFSYDQNNQPRNSAFLVRYDANSGAVRDAQEMPLAFRLLTTAAGKVLIVGNPSASFLLNSTNVVVAPGTGLSERDIFIGELNGSLGLSQVLFSGGGPGAQSILDAAINPVTGSVVLQLSYSSTPQIGTLTFEPATSTFSPTALVQFTPTGVPQRTLPVTSPVSAYAFNSTRVAVSATDDPFLVIPVATAGSQFGSLPRVDLLYPGGVTLAVAKAGLLLGTAPAAGRAAPLGLFPNPARESVTLTASGSVGGTVHLIDALGRTCWQGTTGSDARISIPVAALAPGLYVVRVTRPDGRSVSQRLTVGP